MPTKILTMLLAFACLGFSPTASADDSHDSHQRGEIQITAKIVRIIDYENGMSLILDREIEPNVTCVHLENAASFSKRKLDKINAAKEMNQTISLKIVDGHISDVL